MFPVKYAMIYLMRANHFKSCSDMLLVRTPQFLLHQLVLD